MCVQCGTCVKNCPAGALSFDADGKVAFNPAKCVQCDTCIHVCPNDSSPRTCEMTPEEVYAKVKNRFRLSVVSAYPVENVCSTRIF